MGLSEYHENFGPEIALNTPVAGANDTVVNTTNWLGTTFTLPTTSPFYTITKFEVLNGTVVNGSFFCAAVQVYDNPATNPPVITVATSEGNAQSGASAVQQVDALASLLIRGGRHIHAYISSNSASGRYGSTTVASANYRKAITYVATGAAIGVVGGGSWVAATETAYLKVYGRAVG